MFRLREGFNLSLVLGTYVGRRENRGKTIKPPEKHGIKALAVCIAALTITGCDSYEEQVAEMKSNVPEISGTVYNFSWLLDVSNAFKGSVPFAYKGSVPFA